MGSRPQRRRTWTLAALAAASVTLVAPADALAARGFKLASPKLGDMSVARVELRATGTAPLAGMRVANARRLPRNIIVAGRLSQIGGSKRYIARVLVLRSDRARLRSDRARRGGSTQLVPGVDFEIVGGRVLPLRRIARVNVITEPDIPPECFGGVSDREWRRLVSMVDRYSEIDYERRLGEGARRLICGLPVPRSFPGQFGTREPAAVFGGVHGRFNGSRLEHVFQIHGNVDAAGLSIDPPAGGAFTSCAGAPCFIESGRILILGPVPAGTDIDVNGRANLDIGVELSGDAYQGNNSGAFEGNKHRFRIGFQPD